MHLLRLVEVESDSYLGEDKTERFEDIWPQLIVNN